MTGWRKDNEWGTTALDRAKNNEIKALLRAAEAAVDAGAAAPLPKGKDKWGRTALMYASMYGQMDIVRELIAADNDGRRYNHGELIRMKDNYGETALDRAKNDEIKALLTAAEAAAQAEEKGRKRGCICM